ncbi:MAG: hypothetical protein NW215_12375 [Hyphomicrobiales bacterium]|nr:hypothetical protein [Hyphomicrobiales bacterium]
MMVEEGRVAALVNPNAFFALGVRYATGRDVELDLVAAHKWFNIAASLGHAEAAAHRKELACELSAGQIAEAQRQARQWLSAHQSKPTAPARPKASGAASALLAALKAHKHAHPKAVFDWAR